MGTHRHHRAASGPVAHGASAAGGGPTVSGPVVGSRSAVWSLVAICVGYFMVILDTMVVNVALPALSRSLHTTTTELEWVVDAYSLTFAALLLSGGALGDRRGAKAVFMAGMSLFALSSLACGLSPTPRC